MQSASSCPGCRVSFHGTSSNVPWLLAPPTGWRRGPRCCWPLLLLSSRWSSSRAQAAACWHTACFFFFLSFFSDFIYLFLERGEGREKERERNINQLPPTHPPLGTWPATQARALTGNGTSDLPVCGTMLHPLGHTGQGTCGHI